MTTDFTEKNRQVFDKQARTYKSDFEKTVDMLVRTVQTERTWVSDNWTDTEAGKGKDIKMLEYACGPGYMTLALSPFVTSAVGVDLSDNMIEEFTKHVQEAGRSDSITGINANLLSETPPLELSGPEFFDFDLVLVSMALHHFENPELALLRLGERLKKGGVMMVLDLVPEEGLTHEHVREQMGDVVDTISKHGFSSRETEGMFGDAGVGGGFMYKVLEEPVEFTKDGKTFRKTIFMARGEN